MALLGRRPIKKAVNATMYTEFANMTMMLVGSAPHSSNLQAMSTMKISEIHEVAKK